MAEESEKSSLSRRMQMRGVDRSINKSQENTKKQIKDYTEVVKAHLREHGPLVCISDDKTFAGSLRDLVINILKMPAACVNTSAQPDNLIKLSRQAAESKSQPIFLIDTTAGSYEMAFPAKLLKNAFPELKVIMMTNDAEKSQISLINESGVDGCIIKPLDHPALLEKIALVINPSDQVDRIIDWAKNLMKQEEYLRALQICSQALERQGTSMPILLTMGDIFKVMKEFDKSVETYLKAAKSSPYSLEPLKKLVELYGEKGNPVKQLEYLEKMDELSPLNLERKIQIGELALKINKPDKARKLFDQAMKVTNRQANEKIASIAYRVADIYTDSDPEMAASFLQRGLYARKEFWSKDDAPTFNRLGLLLRRSGKWKEAVEEYKKAIKVMPNEDSLHYNLSMAYLEGKDIEHARASALKALAVNPDLPKRSSRIATNLATVFLESNDKMHAIPLLKSALEQDPSNTQAKEMLEKAG